MCSPCTLGKVPPSICAAPSPCRQLFSRRSGSCWARWSASGTCIPTWRLPSKIARGPFITSVHNKAPWPSGLFIHREILGSEPCWQYLLASNAIPGFIQLVTLPWFPESPRYLLIDRGDKEACINGAYIYQAHAWVNIALKVNDDEAFLLHHRDNHVLILVGFNSQKAIQTFFFCSTSPETPARLWRQKLRAGWDSAGTGWNQRHEAQQALGTFHWSLSALAAHHRHDHQQRHAALWQRLGKNTLGQHLSRRFPQCPRRERCYVTTEALHYWYRDTITVLGVL